MIGKVQDLVSAAVVIGATESTPGINETAASEAASSATNQEQQPQQDMAETPAASPDILSQVKNAANGTDHMQDGKTDKDKQEGDLDKKLDEKSVSYITEELKEFETKILGAQEKIVNIEYNLFTEVRETIKTRLAEIQSTAHEIAIVDVLVSLAEAATTYNYVRPRMTTDGEISIKDGRHPLVERILTRDLFVPNDTKLNHHDCEIMLITGPNMAGKSTYMRQTALLTLMAQIGSFIPAREAAISPVDRIFTRIGASDDLVSGQSTFMVEMNEVAQILKYATKNSLVILDEIGRGTSTFDGMSIARAVIEHIEKKVHAKTLFATHYHELTDLEDDKIKNFCVAVKERGTQVAFLRRIVAGSADKSYGIHVARLAGLPAAVTKRAEDILAELEDEHGAELAAAAARVSKAGTSLEKHDGRKLAADDAMMGSLFASSLSNTLLGIDVMTMTPLEAMNTLYKLQEQAKKEAGQA